VLFLKARTGEQKQKQAKSKKNYTGNSSFIFKHKTPFNFQE